MKRTVSLFLTVVLLSVCLCGCSVLQKFITTPPEESSEPTETVEDMIARCNAACNNADLGGILDCITPKVADPIRATIKVAEKLGGQSEEEMLDIVIGLFAGSEVSDSMQVCRTLKIEVKSVDRDGDDATASLKFSYELDGQKYIGTTNAECDCIDGKWYLAKLTAA